MLFHFALISDYFLMPPMKFLIIILPVVFGFSSCATITQSENTPIAMSLSDGSRGTVTLSNKRGTWQSPLPATVSVRRSDDPLVYSAKNSKGKTLAGSIPSTMGAKIIASAIFLDFGIVDSITDAHREYPASYVIPVTAD